MSKRTVLCICPVCDLYASLALASAAIGDVEAAIDFACRITALVVESAESEGYETPWTPSASDTIVDAIDVESVETFGSSTQSWFARPLAN